MPVSELDEFDCIFDAISWLEANLKSESEAGWHMLDTIIGKETHIWSISNSMRNVYRLEHRTHELVDHVLKVLFESPDF